jgi:WS/DGAT/MGAT family acyltransferase
MPEDETATWVFLVDVMKHGADPGRRNNPAFLLGSDLPGLGLPRFVAGAYSPQTTMADAFYERLSALDAIFLDLESETAPMHVGAALLFDAKPLTLEHGGLDMERITKYTLAALETMPRYRQRLAWVPGLRHPVWIDDDRFNINFHLRHTRLPLPGDERRLKRLVGRLFSQHLDRSRPLWEFWIVEGIENDQFALIGKAHHCMVDGVAGVGLIEALLQMTPVANEKEPEAWTPRRAPSRTQLLRAEVKHRMDGLRKLSHFGPRIRNNFRGVVGVLQSGMKAGPNSPFTAPDISPYRRFDWTSFDLNEVKAIKNALGGTINDVVLATTTAAIRRFLQARSIDVDSMTGFRAFLPVNTRKGGGITTGNRVAMLLAELPVSEPDPIERLKKVVVVTTKLKKESNQTAGAELLEDVADLTTKRLILDISREAIRRHAYNVVVTNIPGPPFPLYMLGARVKAMFPLVPIPPTQNLGIALFSYNGGLHWGFNADWEGFPDVHEFVEDLEATFEEYKQLAATRERRPAATPPQL